MARQLAGIHLVAGDERGLPVGVRDALYSPRRTGELRREVDSILAALDGREENC